MSCCVDDATVPLMAPSTSSSKNRCPCRTVCHRRGCIGHSPVWQLYFAAVIADYKVADPVEDESLTAADRKGSDGVGVTGVCRSWAGDACSRNRFLKGFGVTYNIVMTRKLLTKVS